MCVEGEVLGVAWNDWSCVARCPCGNGCQGEARRSPPCLGLTHTQGGLRPGQASRKGVFLRPGDRKRCTAYDAHVDHPTRHLSQGPGTLGLGAPATDPMHPHCTGRSTLAHPSLARPEHKAAPPHGRLYTRGAPSGRLQQRPKGFGAGGQGRGPRGCCTNPRRRPCTRRERLHVSHATGRHVAIRVLPCASTIWGPALVSQQSRPLAPNGMAASGGAADTSAL